MSLHLYMQPEWWTRMPEQPQPGSPGAGSGEPGVSISSVFQEGTWVVIQQDDAKKPIPRYEQGAALLGSQLYVLGGHYGELGLTVVFQLKMDMCS
jgi:hypothetical protein